MSIFTPDEIEYLGSGFLGRLATVGPDGTPHIAPVGMISYNPHLDTMDIRGHDLTNTKKYRDIARYGRAAIVVDDLTSTKPWRPRPSQEYDLRHPQHGRRRANWRADAQPVRRF
ncbi:MAG: PPOX class F420-dependent oxidoreductase [Rubrobacter sp.]|jgi:pyridoxamine 5'-phosphate oxidase family protein